MSKVKTRSSTTAISDFIGPGKDFIPSELPTNRAVIQKGILLKEQKSMTCNLHHNKYSNKDLASDLIPFVLAQWRKANVKFQQPVIIGEKSLYYRIKTLWEKVENVAWGRTKAKVKEELILKLDKLMDLITCPHKILLCEHDMSGCSSPQNCKSKAHINCTCIFSKKIPTMELRWLYSQRNKTGEKSDMQMGHADKIETTKLRKKYKRKISDEKAYEKRMKKLQDDQASFEVNIIS